KQYVAVCTYYTQLVRAPNHLEEMHHLPAADAEGSHDADGTHEHVDETIGVSERLRSGLCLDNAVEDFGGGRFAGLGVRMIRVSRAHPFETEVEEEPLHVRHVVQPVVKA